MFEQAKWGHEVRGAEPGSRPPAAKSPAYAAFISYSHAVDGQLAPALQAGLHQFAKPWYRLRALRVFRDEASLSANPALWASIEAALSSSEFFVLLASPDAAASPWVDREVEWWLAQKGQSRLLIALTDGEIHWDRPSGDFDWTQTTALPPSLRGVLTEEPRHIDLRWARDAGQLLLTNPRFRDCVADIAAPVHGRAKDDLFGEDVRQHRRTVRLARSAIAGLTVLAFAATAGAVVAVDQRNTAREQARVATSRQLAATARSLVDSQFDVAMLLGLAGVRARDTPQARGSLFSVLERNPSHVAFLHGHRGTGTVVEFTGDGRKVVSADSLGTILVWDADGKEPVGEFRSPAGGPAIESIGVSADGDLIATGARDGSVAIWDMATAQLRRTWHAGDRALGAVAFSGDATLLATGDSMGTVAVWRVETGAEMRRLHHGDTTGSATSFQAVTRLAFSSDGQRLDVGGSFATATSWNLETGANVRPFVPSGVGPRDTTASAFSPAGGLVAWGNRTGVGVVPPGQDYFDSPRADIPGTPESMAFDPNGRLLAVGGQSAVRLFDATSLEPLSPNPILTGYPGRIASIAISPTAPLVAAVAGRTVVLSDLERRHRLGHVVSEPHDVANVYLGDRSMSFAPDGAMVAWLDPQGAGRRPEVLVWNLLTRVLRRFPVDDDGRLVAFSPNGQTLVVAGGETAVDWSPDGRRLGTRAQLPNGGLDISFTSDGHGYVWYPEFGFRKESQLILRDVDTAEIVFSGAGAEGVVAAAISPDGILARGVTGGSIVLWDLDLRDDVGALAPASDSGAPIESLAYSRDGQVLASLSAGTITLWDAKRQTPSFTLPFGGKASLALSGDGSLLAAGGEDGSITVWQVTTRQLLGTLRGAPPVGAFAVGVAFAPDGNSIASIIHGGGLMLWDLSLSSWADHVCAVARRDLTDEEWRLHVGSAVRRTPVCRRRIGRHREADGPARASDLLH